MRHLRLLLLVLVAVLALPLQATDAPLAPGPHTAELNGVKLWYKVAGHGPVALVPAPGWGSSSDYLSLSLAPLEQQFTMVYLDTRGSGRSGMPAGDGDITWADFTADLAALQRHLGVDKVWLIGHSMGGVEVMHYALAAPERVQGLILIDTLAQHDAAYRKDLDARLQRHNQEPWFPAAIKAAQAMPATDAEFEAQMQAMLPMYFADPARIPSHAEVFRATTMSAEAFRRSQNRRPDLLAELPRISAPTLIVVGSDDLICSPTQAGILHRGIPHSKLLLIEDAGHFPFIEQPEAFFAGVRAFLPSVGYAAAPASAEHKVWPGREVAAMHLPVLPGDIVVHYSTGYARRAAAVRPLISEMMRFYKAKLGIEDTMSVAVLDADDWKQALQGHLPYGLPFVTDTPHMAFLPATADGVITQGAIRFSRKASPATLAEIRATGYGVEDGALKFTDLIGLHELGHVLSRSYGIDPRQRWLGEFVASYFAYAFLEQTHPRLARLFVAMASDVYRDAATPQHTSLADFEELYVGLGPDNYGWYQGRFLKEGAAIYAHRKLALLKEMKSAALSPDTAEALQQLARIDTEFATWPQKFH
ncbi:MAG TPA: alpha/beta hydrolase [Rhodanobacteraceae bacterium]|nr:alpha/beta hydrolase [Rhodanobacteraceae bacterium]